MGGGNTGVGEEKTKTTVETIYQEPSLSQEESNLLDLLKFVSGVSGETEGEFQFTETPEQQRLREFTESLQEQVGSEFIDPVLEAQIASERTALEADLQRRFGSDWASSSAGIQTLASFEASADLQRQSARQGRQTSLTGDITDLLQTAVGTQSEGAGNISDILSVLAAREPVPIKQTTRYKKEGESSKSRAIRLFGPTGTDLGGAGGVIGSFF